MAFIDPDEAPATERDTMRINPAVQAQRDADANRIRAAEGSPTLQEEQAGIKMLAGYKTKGGVPAKAKSTSQFLDPDDFKDPDEEKKGFFDTLRNPVDLWTNESLPAHVYKAYQKGTFNKPIGELVASAAEEVKNFNFSELVEAAKKEPGRFSGELVNAIVADPELLFTPFGLGGAVATRMTKMAATGMKMAKAGETAAKVVTGGVKIAGKSAEAGTMGGATMATISAAQQLDEAGYIDPRKVMQDAKMGAMQGAALVGMLNLGAATLKVKPSELWAKVQQKMGKGKGADDALGEVLKEYGMKDTKAFTDPIKERGDVEAFNEQWEAHKKGQPKPMTAKEKAAAEKAQAERAKQESEAARLRAEMDELNKKSNDEILSGINRGQREGERRAPMDRRTSTDIPYEGTEKRVAEGDRRTGEGERRVAEPRGSIHDGVELGSLAAKEARPGFLKSAEERIGQEAKGTKERTPLAERLAQEDRPPKVEPTIEVPFSAGRGARAASTTERLAQDAAARAEKTRLSDLMKDKEGGTTSFGEKLKAAQVEKSYAEREAAKWDDLERLHNVGKGAKQAEQAERLARNERGEVDPRLLTALAAAGVTAAAWPFLSDDVKNGLKIAGIALAAVGAAKGTGALRRVLKARGFESPEFVRKAAAETQGMAQMTKQGGKASPGMLRHGAMLGVGAMIGSALSDDPQDGAMLGAALAAGGMAAAKAVNVLKNRMGDTFDRIMNKDTRFRIDDMRRAYQKDLAQMEFDVSKVAYGLKKLVGDAKRREELSFYVEEGIPALAPKTPAEAAYVKMLTDAYAKLGASGQASGVLGKLIAEGSYITHLFDLSGEGLQKAKSAFSNMNPNSPFAQKRGFPTLREAMNAGYKPITLDSAEIFEIYGRSLSKSIANRKLLDGLKKGFHPDGRGLIARAKDAPPDYVPINHPQLMGLKVNPEIAPSLELIYTSYSPNAITNSLLAMASVAKRALFSFSMFHGMALTEAALAAQGNLFKGMGAVGETLGRVIRNKHWLEGQFGAEAREALGAGVKFEPRAGVDAEHTVFNKMLTKTLDASESMFGKGRFALAAAGAAAGAAYSDDPIAGGLVGAGVGFTAGRKLTQAARYVDQKLNTLLWDKLHPTYKIITYRNAQERLLAKYAKAADRGEPTPPLEEIQRQAATFTNDMFGGQDWIDIAEGVQSKFWRDISMAAASPAGRTGMSIGLLAPDWTVSTFRSVSKAVPGLSKEQVGALHRSYVMNSALMYLTLGDALNVYFSGHHVWENEDPTYIELGDGRKMQLNKHFMETIHWAQHPFKTLKNKLSVIPRTALDLFNPQVSGEKAAKNFVSAMTPIPATNILSESGTGTSAVAGALGLPIYGKTYEEQEEAKARKKERAAEKKRKKEEEE